MLKRIYLLANTNAGSGLGGTVLAETQSYLHSLHLSFITYTSDYPSHMIELTEQIIQKEIELSEIKLVVIGGDGTLHEVLATLMHAKVIIDVHYLPAGTGNDFNRTWQNGLSAKELMQQIPYNIAPTTIPIFQINNQDIILNSLGFGLDGQVIQQRNQLAASSFIKRFKNGKYSYLVSTLKSVLNLSNFSVNLIIDNQKITIENCQFICFMNSPYLGNGIRLFYDDSTNINIIFFRDVTAFSLIKILFDIFVLKKKTSSSKYTHMQAQTVGYHVHQAVLSQVDGELRHRTDQETATISIASYPICLPEQR